MLEGEPRQLAARGGRRQLRDRAKGETLALVGESGCGKSTVARLIVGLYAPTRGRIEFDGTDLAAPGTDAPALRRRMQMIFQDPYASLNPRWRVRDIVAEPVRELGLVGEPARPSASASPSCCARWGSRPRTARSSRTSSPAGSASASRSRGRSSGNPEFLVCDEPTSALDVSVQAQILNLMNDLQERLGLTYLFISHNLAVVAHIADRVGVMYLGRLVELADGAAAVRRARGTPTRACCWTRSRTSHMTRQGAHAGGGRGAQPARAARRLRLPPALPARQRPLPRRAAGAPRSEHRRGRLPRRAGKADLRASDRLASAAAGGP